jgi:quercetin dioxygenase-like cupin family protein
VTTIVLPEQRVAVGREGRGLEIVLPRAATGGAAAVMACTIPAATAGPPVHVHPESDETFFMLSGALLVYLDGRVTRITEGTLVHVSRGTPHTFATPVDGAARFLAWLTPGGFEEFHVAAARAEQEQGGPLSRDDLIALAQGFDWQFAGPPLLPTGALLPAAQVP